MAGLLLAQKRLLEAFECQDHQPPRVRLELPPWQHGGWHRLSSVALPRQVMDRTHPWRWLAVLGVLGIAQGFADIAPPGPWDSPSFSRGVLGLCGLVCLYLAWFRYTFDLNGVAPTMDRWKNPQQSWINVVLFGLACLLVVKLVTWLEYDAHLPEPTGLLVTLIGCLVVLNGVYVGLVVQGPFRLHEEE